MVLDDARNRPLAHATLFIQGTPYGAVANARGEFSLLVALDWPPAQGGALTLEVSAGAFEFRAQLVDVLFADGQSPAPLVGRLLSRPDRGLVVGRVKLVPPPVAPPT